MSDDTSASSFSPEQERTLASVLNEIIPPSADGRMPGAGDLGLIAQIAETMRQRPELEPVLTRGLAALDGCARRSGAADFAALARAARVAALHEVGAAEEGFLIGLMLPTYLAYYQHARVLEGLGREPRPPFPKGYEIPPFTHSLVDPVRARPPMYRKV